MSKRIEELRQCQVRYVVRMRFYKELRKSYPNIHPTSIISPTPSGNCQCGGERFVENSYLVKAIVTLLHWRRVVSAPLCNPTIVHVQAIGSCFSSPGRSPDGVASESNIFVAPVANVRETKTKAVGDSGCKWIKVGN